MSDDEMNIAVVGHAGVITLTRPRALNALSLHMIRAITQALQAWQNDPQVAHVIIRSSEARAFCAGGDIRAVYAAMKDGHTHLSPYFAEEYALNLMIARYPKPYTALMDGYVMGGGVGISIHGHNRVGTPAVIWAMPETAIGFMPDVGASYFLNHMPRSVGYYLGVTGARITAQEAVYCGALTHMVAQNELPQLFEALCVSDAPDGVLAPFPAGQGSGAIVEHAAEIEAIFGLAHWQDMLAQLQARAAHSTFAAETLALVQQRCPMSVAVTFEMLRAARGQSLEICLQHEVTIAEHMIARQDFIEGVRAVVVDKDNTPRWLPVDFTHITTSEVAGILAAR